MDNSSLLFNIYFLILWNNGYYTDVFYTEKDGLSKQLVLFILIDGIAYITTLNFDKSGDDYYMNFYVCHELFTKVSHSLFEKDGAFSTAPYFKAMSDYIVSHTPITTLHRKELKSYHCYSFTEENKPYFLTTRRGKMTQKMKEKIIKKYNKELAAKIFRICGTTRTLVFTSSVERSNLKT